MVVTCIANRCTDAVGSLRYVTPAVLCIVLNKYQSCPPHHIFPEPIMSSDPAAQSVVSGYSNDHWDNDPANPRQWSSLKKWLAMGIVRNFLLLCWVSQRFRFTSDFLLHIYWNIGWLHDGLSCAWYSKDLWYDAYTSALWCLYYAILSPGITNSVILSMTLSIFYLSFALGPLFDGPLSEIYGRQWVTRSLTVCFISLALMPIFRSCISVTWLMEFWTWDAPSRPPQDLWLHSVFSVCILNIWYIA